MHDLFRFFMVIPTPQLLNPNSKGYAEVWGVLNSDSRGYTQMCDSLTRERALN